MRAAPAKTAGPPRRSLAMVKALLVLADVAHAVWGVGPHGFGGLSGHQPGHIAGLRGVPNQESVVAQYPELSGLDVGFLRQIGGLVGVGQTGLGQVAGQVGQECGETRVIDGERRQQLVEDRLLGDRHGGDGIEGRQNERLLLLGQLDVEDGHCGLASGEGLFDSGMAIDEMAGGGIDYHLGHPADGIERAPQSCSLLGRMAAPVAGVGQELARVLRSGADYPGAPGCGGAHRSDPKVTKTAKPGCTHTRRAARSPTSPELLCWRSFSRGKGAAR